MRLVDTLSRHQVRRPQSMQAVAIWPAKYLYLYLYLQVLGYQRGVHCT